MLINLIKKIIAIAALFMAASGLLKSEVTISIPDTIIPRDGKTHLVPVYGNLKDATGSKIKIKLVFNALCLDIKGAEGGDSFLIKTLKPVYSQNLDILNEAYCEISADEFTKSEGTIFTLEIEALVGPDSVTTLKPSDLFIDDSSTSGNFKSGLINVGNPTVIQKYPEGIFTNHPNPFDYNTIFSFNISDSSKISIRVYSTGGRQVYSIPLDHNASMDFTVRDNSGKVIADVPNYYFPEGNYSLELFPKRWELANGAYFIVMETTRGVYRCNFIFQK